MSDGAAAPAKGRGKGAPAPKAAGKAGGKGLTYKEKKEAELKELEDKLSAEPGFSGKVLTEEEAGIIEGKGTEAPNTGEYESFKPMRGYFACRKCGKPIYSCQAKFESGCGWPAFDKCYAGSILSKPEDDGTDRVEITCANCGAHLGHVFLEPGVHGQSRSDQRHCANSRSLQYVKHDPPEGVAEEAVLELPARGGAEVTAAGPGRSGSPARWTLMLETRGDNATFPKAGDTVTIHYTGSLLATGAEFDTSRDGDPFEFQVGGGAVIRGWDEGVQKLALGARGLLLVPAALAYGERGMPGAIPPNSDLAFDLQLMSVNGQKAPRGSAADEPTGEGLLHQQLTPALRPVVTGLLRQRPADPFGYLLQHLTPGSRAAEEPPAEAAAEGTAEEYAARVRPLLEEMAAAALGRAEQPGQALREVLGWLQQQAGRQLPKAPAPAEASA